MMRIYKPEKDLSRPSDRQGPLRRATSVNYSKDGAIISNSQSQGSGSKVSQLNLDSVNSDKSAGKSPRKPPPSEPAVQSSPREKSGKTPRDKLKTPRDKEKDKKSKASPRPSEPSPATAANDNSSELPAPNTVASVIKQYSRTSSASVSGPASWFSTLKSRAPDEKEQLRAQLTVEKQRNEQLQTKLEAEQTMSATLKSYLESEKKSNEQLKQEIASLQRQLEEANQKLQLAQRQDQQPEQQQQEQQRAQSSTLSESSSEASTTTGGRKQSQERRFGFDRSLSKLSSESTEPSPRPAAAPSPREVPLERKLSSPDAAGGDASQAGKHLERTDSETEKRAATPPRAGSTEASDSETERTSAPGSPKKRLSTDQSMMKANPSVIAQRISSLQRGRSSSVTAGMPKQLTKTPTAGIASSPVVLRDSLGVPAPANSAPSSPLRHRMRSSTQLTSDDIKSAAPTRTSDESESSDDAEQESSKKRIDARRQYRKRTASEILGPAAPPRQGASLSLSKLTPKDKPAEGGRPGSPNSGSQPSPSRSHKAPPQTEAERKALAEAAKQEMRDVISEEWRVDFADCYFEKTLGKGVNSIVYYGKWKEQEVALKVLRVENIQRDLEDFKGELEVMTQLRSPHIVHFFGAATEPKFCMVIEYCAHGSLFHHMQDTAQVVTWKLVLQWGQEMAKGVNALHSWKTPIVHRDLKSLNLLLDGNLHLKVCDFGLSRFVGESEEDKHKTLYTLRGTYAYVAPEIYFKEMYSHKSDVYSMGIVFWEMMMRALKGRYSRPYSEYPELVHDFQVILQATKGVRPTIPDACPVPLANLIRMCWSMDPEERPSSAELIEHFDLLQKDYQDNRATWDAALYTNK